MAEWEAGATAQPFHDIIAAMALDLGRIELWAGALGAFCEPARAYEVGPLAMRTGTEAVGSSDRPR